MGSMIALKSFDRTVLAEPCSPDFRATNGPSPHYTGLPELLRLAECLAIPVPTDLCVLAMEVEDPYRIREGLSLAVDQALSGYVERARQILDGWQQAALVRTT